MSLFESGEPNGAVSLKGLFIVNDVDAWCPAIWSKAAIRASRKRNLVDPSILGEGR